MCVCVFVLIVYNNEGIDTAGSETSKRISFAKINNLWMEPLYVTPIIIANFSCQGFRQQTEEQSAK